MERYAELRFRFDASNDKVPCVSLQPSFSPSLVGVPIEGLRVPGYAYCRKMIDVPCESHTCLFRTRRSRTVMGGHRRRPLGERCAQEASLIIAQLVAFWKH